MAHGSQTTVEGTVSDLIASEIASAVWVAMDRREFPLQAAREVVFDNGLSWHAGIERVYAEALDGWYRERTTGCDGGEFAG